MHTQILLTMLALGSSFAHAQSWCHAQFVAQDRSEVELHYQVDKYDSRFMGTIWDLKNAWLHVRSPGMSGQEKVRFVVLNLRKLEDNSFAEEARVHQVDATYDSLNKRFTAPVIDFFLPIKYQFGTDFKQEIAVVVDGQWLKDSVSSRSNFEFNANTFDNYCVNPF